jgi:hypothetical protein
MKIFSTSVVDGTTSEPTLGGGLTGEEESSMSSVFRSGKRLRRTAFAAVEASITVMLN